MGSKKIAVFIYLSLIMFCLPIWCWSFDVVSILPSANSHTAEPDALIQVTFDSPVNPGTVSNSTFIVRGSMSGFSEGVFQVNGTIVTFDSTSDYKTGEEITIMLTVGITGGFGVPLTAPYSWQFRIRVLFGFGLFYDSGQSLGNSNSRDGFLADLDGDGDLDIIVGNSDYQPNKVWLNDGSGFFSDSGQSLGTERTTNIAMADLDGDGDLDVYFTNETLVADTVWFNDGTAQFTDSGQQLGNYNTSDVDLADLDGDGDIDAFVTQPEYLDHPHPDRIWLNDGAGNFTDSGQELGNYDSSRVELADLDSDGDLDAFVVTYGIPMSFVWLNDGYGIFLGTGQETADGGISLALSDFDTDGDVDVFITKNSYNKVWFNNGSAVYTDSGQNLGSAWHYAYCAAVGDCDGDADLDVFVGTKTKDILWLNDGSGFFASNTQQLGNEVSNHVSLGDIDGDGDLDAVVIKVGPNSVYFNKSATIGDFVWDDLNANGLQDIGETGHEGITVNLYDSSDILLATTVTGDDGLFSFSDLIPDTYYLEFILLEHYKFTLVDQGSDDAVDSDADQITGKTPLFDLHNDDLTWDAGLIHLAAVGNRTWYDGNNDGLQSGDESGLGGVIVNLYDDSKSLFDSTMTDNNGSYQFIDLDPGNFSLEFIPLSCFQFSPQNQGTDDSLDSDPDTTTGLTAVIELSQGEEDMSWDAGFYAPMRVTSRTPERNTNNVSRTANIIAEFTENVAAATVTSNTYIVYGSQSSYMSGTYSVQDNVVTFDPDVDFARSECVSVVITTGITSTSGHATRSENWHFVVAIPGGTADFLESDQILGDVRLNDVELGDLDGDNDLDIFLTTWWYNKIFINDGSGQYSDSGQQIDYPENTDVALGDIDGDGDLDAFTANGNSSTPYPNKVWLNDGSGVFSDSGQALGNSRSYAVALADFDNDGDLDAFISNYAQPEKVWLNDGNGIFSDSGQEIDSSCSLSFDIGDLDDDGDIDVFLSSGATNPTDLIWLNNGNAQFSPFDTAPTIDHVGLTVLGDLDGDNDLDAFVLTSVENRIWFNDGHGVFTDSGQLLGNSGSADVRLGDLDGDGDLDAVVAKGNYKPDKIWINDGTGIFMDTGQLLETTSTQNVCLGDIDNDQDLDIIFAHWIPYKNKVWFNSNNQFIGDLVWYDANHDGIQDPGEPPVHNVTVKLYSADHSLVDTILSNANGYLFRNLNPGEYYVEFVPGADYTFSPQDQGSDDTCDSDPDPVTGKTSLISLSLLESNITLDAGVSGPFLLLNTTPQRHSILASGTTDIVLEFSENVDAATVTNASLKVIGSQTGIHVITTDVNGPVITCDPQQDFAYGERVSVIVTNDIHNTDCEPVDSEIREFMIAPQHGGMNFVGSNQSFSSNSSRYVALGDLDGDNDLDAFISAETNEVWLNDGSGAFVDSEQSLGDSDKYYFNIALADIDNDGDLDAFVAATGMSYEDEVWLNNGSGVFSLSGQVFNTRGTHDVALGDLNNDGFVDAFIPQYGSYNENRVYLNNGSGYFIDTGQLLGNYESEGVALGDLDNDGDLDAFVANENQEANRVWKNDGTGIFSDTGQTLGLNNSQSVALGDIDNDGDLDAIVTNGNDWYNPQADTIWLNDGNGFFSWGFQYFTPGINHDVALADFDNDGDLDAVFSDPGSRQYLNSMIRWNNGNGNFSVEQLFPGTIFSRSVAKGDLDGDGDIDLIFTNFTNANKIFFNTGNK